ncbi:glycosyltransferase [Nocardia sp. BMG51109]|uniref:glycosyltransferase n=1 Tax=Nocardia sp. BMG51109 TaxID=1056816 RepID=UPI0004AF9791|nr:glycosyltransferase [Nocardia sp. BMG51109]
MRMLFSAVPAYGHILPLAPLMAAAIDAGHTVALLASADVRSLADRELAPGAEFLAAGAGPEVLVAEAARRTGADPLRPGPGMIGETFGNTRLELDAEETFDRAREWAPDLVVAETFDTVGPLIAARLNVPWHQAAVGPGVASVLTEIARSVAPHYERAGVRPVTPSSYIDPWPSALQDPEWVAPAPVLPVRARAHRRPAGVIGCSGGATDDLPRFTDPGKPTVLLTLGTVFSDESTLAEIGPAVADADVNVLVTLGLVVQQPPAAGARGELRHVSFAPLDTLLDDVELVVAAGGSGTILGALSRGIPLVLWPQGADQPINAARAAAAGVALVVDSAAAVTAAVERALHDEILRSRVAEVAAENAGKPTPAEVMAILADDARRIDTLRRV